MPDTKNHTPAFKATKYYFTAFMEQHRLFSAEYVRAFGIPTSGNREVDRELASSPTLCHLTIWDMAHHLHEGANITLEFPEKSVEIYEIITALLEDWRQISQNPVNSREIPMDELRKLDKLAQEVYQIARGYMTKAPVASRLFDSIASLERRRGISRNGPKSEDQIRRDVPHEHTPVSDTISKNLFQTTRQWR